MSVCQACIYESITLIYLSCISCNSSAYGWLADNPVVVRSSGMRSRIHAVACRRKSAISPTRSARCFSSSAAPSAPSRWPASAAPPLDVYETDDALEITVDLPGVDPGAVRVIGKGDSVLIAGEKAARRARPRIELSSGRARLRPLRARRPPRTRLRHGEGARDARQRRAAHLGPEDRERAARIDRDRRITDAEAMADGEALMRRCPWPSALCHQPFADQP